MDDVLPQISHLSEQNKPPTPKKKLRVRLKPRAVPPPPVLPPTGAGSEEDEEDELVSELDEATRQPTAPKGKGKATKGTPIVVDPPPMAAPFPPQGLPSMSTFAVDVHGIDGALLDRVAAWTSAFPSTASTPVKTTPKQKAPTRKVSAPNTKPTSTSKINTSVASLSIPNYIAMDDGNLSEGYTGTAASSPVTHNEINKTPEPPELAGPPEEEIDLTTVPLPVYPLPTKPFPVQQPAKIGTGSAPVIPLDRSGAQPRPWRVAHREIRGIAGGRWYARSWVGRKSDNGGSDAENSVAAAPTPKARSKKTQSANTPSSRASPGAAVLELNPFPRASTKLRIVEDSEMTLP